MSNTAETIAAELPWVAMPTRILTDLRMMRRPSEGKSDTIPAGAVAVAAVANKAGKLPGWGIVPTAGKKIRAGGPDGEWVIDYDIRPPADQAETEAVADAIAAYWLEQARAAIAQPLDDDRDRAARDARDARLVALIAALAD